MGFLERSDRLGGLGEGVRLGLGIRETSRSPDTCKERGNLRILSAQIENISRAASYIGQDQRYSGRGVRTVSRYQQMLA